MPSVWTVLTIVLFIALWLWVQITLSLRRNKYVGLILPVFCFIGDIAFTSFAANTWSALLAFTVGFIPCGVMLAVYRLCRLYMSKKESKVSQPCDE